MSNDIVLQAATMAFDTHDSKDQDTLLIVRVLAFHGNTIAAEGVIDREYFADNSHNGPFNLGNINALSKDFLFHRTVSFEIQPNGDDVMDV